MNDYKKITTSIEDGQTKLLAEKEEAVNLYEHVIEIKESIGRIEAKVDIHNNYEKRIKSLEKGQSVLIGALLVINFITNIGVVLLIKFLKF